MVNKASAGGGKPLADTLVGTITVSEEQELDRIYRDSLEIIWAEDGIQQPLDPEYLAILDDFDKRREDFKLSHRDLQWQIVANYIKEIDPNESIEFMRTVRAYPFWRTLPPTIAITPIQLEHWNCCRKTFLKQVRHLSRSILLRR